MKISINHYYIFQQILMMDHLLNSFFIIFDKYNKIYNINRKK